MFVIGVHDGHNSSAALLKDGVIVAAIAEERFSRKKHHYGFPRLALSYLLNEYQIQPQDILGVAMATKQLPPKYFQVRRNSSFTVADYWKEQKEYWYPLLYQNKRNKYLTIFDDKICPSFESDYDQSLILDEDDVEGMWKARVKLCSDFLNVDPSSIYCFDHHHCHAAYGYGACNKKHNDRYLVYSVDGGGDGFNGTVSIVEDGKVQEISRSSNCNIGRIYRYATLMLGMRPADHEFKVMGLAAYSDGKYGSYEYECYRETLDNDGLGFKYGVKPKDHFFYFKEKFEASRFDTIAYALQKRTEELLVEWTHQGHKETGISNFIFSGGVAQNIKASKKISEQNYLESIFIPPGPGDESISIGAAILLTNKFHTGDQFHLSPSSKPLPNAYIGIKVPKTTPSNIDLQYKQVAACHVTVEEVAKLLANGSIIGRFDTQCSEFGPRALGARSILADPRNSSVIHKINKLVKVRDFWMPFAPSILEDDVDRYLLNPKKLSAPYMCLGFDTTPEAHIDLAGGVHPFDKTARAQIVYKEHNPSYYNLIQAFKALTGVGAILNTSFNVHGDAIVGTVEDAINTLKKTGLDYVLIDDILVEET